MQANLLFTEVHFACSYLIFIILNVTEKSECTERVFLGASMTWWPPSIWPHLFCGAGHEKRRGERLKWSLAFRL